VKSPVFNIYRRKSHVRFSADLAYDDVTYMAPFNNSPEDWQRLDWEILRDGGIALYWRPEYLAEDVRWLASQNYRVSEFDCTHWNNESEMFSNIGRELAFSECRNFAALDDDLSDLPIREEGGMVLVFRNFHAYATGPGSVSLPSGGNGAEVLLDVMARASHFHLLNGKRFVTLVQTVNPDYRVQGLGCVSATWNHREWLDAKRRPESGKGIP
jgi:hypothetical protein